jgi:hypothetical protein
MLRRSAYIFIFEVSRIFVSSLDINIRLRYSVRMERIISRQRVWQIRNRDKNRAHRAVAVAIDIGRLTPPLRCENCGGVPPLTAHHHKGYEPNHRLDVIWLCGNCHRAAHMNVKHAQPRPIRTKEELLRLRSEFPPLPPQERVRKSKIPIPQQYDSRTFYGPFTCKLCGYVWNGLVPEPKVCATCGNRKWRTGTVRSPGRPRKKREPTLLTD